MNALVAQTSHLSEEQIQVYGRWLVAAVLAYCLTFNLRSNVPSDVRYAIEVHLEQGFTRSLIGARLEQRQTKCLLLKCLGIHELRTQLRQETNREAKIRAWDEMFRLNLIGMLAAAYTHSLSLTLYTVKNAVRVLVFVLSRREARRQPPGDRRGPVAKLKAWWAVGTKHVVLESLQHRMMEQLRLPASPFMTGAQDELSSLGSVGQCRGISPTEAVGQDPQEAVLGHSEEVRKRFSVKSIMEVAVPRIVALAGTVVDNTLANYASSTFSARSVVRGVELRNLLEGLAEEFERRVRVADLVKPATPAEQHLAKRSSGMALEFFEQRHLQNSADEVLEFPCGSTAVIGTDGKSPQDWRKANVMEEMFGPRSPLSSEETAREEAEAYAEHLAKELSADYFEQLIQCASVGELCISYASQVLEGTSLDAGDISDLKSYDPVTDTAKMLMVISYLDGHRQNLFDADFLVPLYLKLFCAEMIRSSCSQ